MKQKETLVATMPGIVMVEGSDGKAVDETTLGREVTDIELRAEALIIENDTDYENAGKFGTMLKQKAAQVVDFFKPMKDSAYKAHKAVCEREKSMLAPLRNAESVVKKSMSAYLMEQERKRREAEEAARRAAEMERERKLQEAAQLEATGDQSGAEEAMEEAMVMDDAATYAVPAAAKPKASGVSTTKDWEITEIDSDKVPVTVAGVELRPVDKAAVMRMIRMSKGKVKIPGITYHEVAKMSFRR